MASGSKGLYKCALARHSDGGWTIKPLPLLLADPAGSIPSNLLEPRKIGLELFVSRQRSRIVPLVESCVGHGLLKLEEDVWQVLTTRVDEVQMAYMHECCHGAGLRRSFLSIAPIV